MTNQNNVSLLKSEAISTSGMVGTKDRYATEIGKAVLDNGGNAIDAAVASCLAIGVVEPTSSGIGGGGYLNFQVGDKGGVIGFPMQASLSANANMYSIISQDGVGSFGWASVKNNENINNNDKNASLVFLGNIQPSLQIAVAEKIALMPPQSFFCSMSTGLEVQLSIQVILMVRSL